jgi:MOSC domain-containing protein YiiM
VISGRLLAVCVGRAGTLTSGSRVVRSAMAKTPVAGPIRLSRLGLPGDEHVYEHHGGPDMAVLVGSAEHHSHWRSRGLDIPEAAPFGENFTVSGLTETEVWIGDTFRVGGAVVQVSQPRTPCHKLAARYGRRDLPMLMQATGFTGYLLRVLAEGDVAAGQELELIDREDHGVSVAEAGQIVNVDRHDLHGTHRVLAVASLGDVVRRTLTARLNGAPHDDDTRLFGSAAGS